MADSDKENVYDEEESEVEEEPRSQTWELRSQTWEPRSQTREPRSQTRDPRSQTREPRSQTMGSVSLFGPDGLPTPMYLNALRSLPTTAYLNLTVVPILRQALVAVADLRPEDPIQFIADFLRVHKFTRIN